MAEIREDEEDKKSGISILPGPELLTLPGFDTRASIASAALSDVPSDVIIKSRIRYGSTLSACKGLLLEYAKSTTIHGIRYIFEVHRPIYEKCVLRGLSLLESLSYNFIVFQTLLAVLHLHFGVLCCFPHLGYLSEMAGLTGHSGF